MCDKICKHYTPNVLIARAVYSGTKKRKYPFHRCLHPERVNVRELVGGPDKGWMKRIPCFSRNKSPVECSGFEAIEKKDLQIVDIT